MDAVQAISVVTEWILWRGLDYPTEGLVADRFDAGWTVYAPVDIDESDPMAFLDMPVGRSVFLVGDSGRIEEVSSSAPPGHAEAEFTAQERAVQRGTDESDESDVIADVEKQSTPNSAEQGLGKDGFGIAGTAPKEGTINLDGDTTGATDE